MKRLIGSSVVNYQVNSRQVLPLSFNVTDIEGTVLLNCAGTFALGLVPAMTNL